MKQRYYINGAEVNEPLNYQELQLEINFDNDFAKETSSVEKWDIGVNDGRTGADGYRILKDIIDKGRLGIGAGVSEGVPFEIYLSDEAGDEYKIYDAFLNLWEAQVNDEKISCPSMEQGGIDWLSDVADSVTFEYLASIGKITKVNYIPVPYVINRKQNGVEIVTAIITLYVVVYQIVNCIQDIIQTINDYDIIYISAIIRVIAQLIYLTILVVTAINLTIDLFNYIVCPVKYHFGMYVKDLFEIGLNHFGLKLSSSILQQAPFNELLILPEKFNLEEFDGQAGNVFSQTKLIDLIAGYTNARGTGYYKGTVGQLIRAMKSMFNARTLIIDGVYYFEKQDFKLNSPAWQIPDVDTNGAYEFNYEDYYSNITIDFQTDLSDRNTIQEYAGNSVQIIHKPVVVNNQKMVLARNYLPVTIPFARGARKTDLTWVEKRLEKFNKKVTTATKALSRIVDQIENAAKSIAKTINKIVKILKSLGIKSSFDLKLPPFSTQIKGTLHNLKRKFDGTRIGMLMMEQDYIAVPKLLMVKSGAVARQNVLNSNNDVVLNAKYLWDNYHYYKSFVPVNGKHNQHLIQSFDGVPFPFESYKQVRDKNYVLTPDGEEARLLSIKFDLENQTASGKYKVNKLYTNNLTLQVIEPDGK